MFGRARILPSVLLACDVGSAGRGIRALRRFSRGCLSFRRLSCLSTPKGDFCTSEGSAWAGVSCMRGLRRYNSRPVLADSIRLDLPEGSLNPGGFPGTNERAEERKLSFFATRTKGGAAVGSKFAANSTKSSCMSLPGRSLTPLPREDCSSMLTKLASAPTSF